MAICPTQSLQIQKILEVLDQQGGKLKIPTFVEGAKLSAVEPAEAQLKRLENLLNAVLSQQPALQQRFAREKIGGGEFLTLRLDGTLVPWPMLMQNMQGMDQQQVQKLVEKLSALKLVISLGVRGDYLIVSIGEDNKHLAGPGTTGLLHDRSELAPVRAAADKPLTEIAYVSAPFLQQIGSVDRQMDQLSAMAKQVLPMAPISPDLQNELTADIERVRGLCQGERSQARRGYRIQLSHAARLREFPLQLDHGRPPRCDPESYDPESCGGRSLGVLGCSRQDRSAGV